MPFDYRLITIMGRTARKRKRPRLRRVVNVSVDPVFQTLQSWLKKHNFSPSPHLRPALFPDTGRGLTRKKSVLYRNPNMPRNFLFSVTPGFELVWVLDAYDTYLNALFATLF